MGFGICVIAVVLGGCGGQLQGASSPPLQNGSLMLPRVFGMPPHPNRRGSHSLTGRPLRSLAATSASAADSGRVPPIPPVVSVTDLGTVTQNPVIYGRDGTFSALVQGVSLWTFGDTPMSVPGKLGDYWDDNSMSWATNLDASHGIVLNHDLLDDTGAPAEYLPYLLWEAKYNYAHDQHHCTQKPCGAEFAMWDGPVIYDAARSRVLFFYYELWRTPNKSGWTSVGSGIAVGSPPHRIDRPVENPGSRTPTLMWGPKEVAYNCGAVVGGKWLYGYGCVNGFLSMNVQIARVPLAAALDKSQWTYYAGDGNWSANPKAAVTIFTGGAAANEVFYSPYLGMYVDVYNPELNNDLYYRVSYTPWGPWSDAAFVAAGAAPYQKSSVDYAGQAHVEFAQGDGQIQYVTYAHPTGFLREDLPLLKVVFGKPGERATSAPKRRSPSAPNPLRRSLSRHTSLP